MLDHEAVRKGSTSPPAHERKVESIAREVRERAAAGEPLHIFKGGVHHFVPLPGDTRFRGRPVDISTLGDVLAIDAERRLCRAEPGVTFAKLLEATLARGLVPTVVPELEGITAGGAVAGCSVESMSYRHGGFHDSCTEYEVVTTAGEVLTCSPDKDALAYEMLHGSYGTLGILTALTFKLVPAKRFVKMEYRRCASWQHFQREMLACCAAGDHDFVDGIVHGPDACVICLGRFVDDAPYTSSYRWLDIFYKSTLARTEDYLTTADYCFRYDTECHWLSRTVPALEWKPVRLLAGKVFLGSTNMIRWSKRLEGVFGAIRRRPDVVVDLFIPARRGEDFFAWYERDVKYFPLWVVPYRIPKMYPWLSDAYAARMGDEMFLDCAIYGARNDDPDVDLSQRLEEKTHELGGIKTLISRNHYSRDAFWQVYDRPRYQAAKKRLDPRGAFPDLFDKMVGL